MPPPNANAGPKRSSTCPDVDELVQRILNDIQRDAASVTGGQLTDAPGGHSPRRPRVLIGVSGSVATIKLSTLVQLVLENADVVIVATDSSTHFIDANLLPDSCLPVITDADEWRRWGQLGDPVMHIELRRWADAFIIAPLSANTLAKVANGMCDNLLTCVVRAWDMGKPLLVAPAMNTYMWESPFTEEHLDACRKLGMRIVPPVSKTLACGDVGVGGMADPADIASLCARELQHAGFDISTVT